MPDAELVRAFRLALDGGRGALGDLGRFPQWMWRNAHVLGFVGWLQGFNENHPASPVGFYGLGLYPLHVSTAAGDADEIVANLDTGEHRVAEESEGPDRKERRSP